MSHTIRRAFGRPTRGPLKTRRPRRDRIRFEALEPRAMLAITQWPLNTGDQFGQPIVLKTVGAGPTNALTIVLDDTITNNFITARINGNDYWNFGGQISFTGTPDGGGNIDNPVTLITPYGVDLTAPGVLAWRSLCDFTASTLPLDRGNIKVDLVDADSLTVQTTIGKTGGPSSIEGTFTTPTLAPLPGATIDFQSSGLITVKAGGVQTYDLKLTTTLNGAPSGVVFNGPVTVNSALNINSKSDVLIDQPLTATGGGSITVTSTAGNVNVNRDVTADGAISLDAAQALTIDAKVTSNLQSVTLKAGTFLTVNQDVKANTFVSASATDGITTTAAADILAVTGALDLLSGSGFVRAAGSLEATASTIAITAGKLDVSTAKVTALSGLTITAGTDATLNGPTTITGPGGVTVTANNDLYFKGPTTLLGTGNLKATATEGDLFVLPLSPIDVTNGTIDLQAVAGAVDIQSRLKANLGITIRSAQGITLSNAVDGTAEVRTTGPAGAIVIANDANRVLVDAPVTSQAGAVTITAAINNIDVVDNVYGLDTVKIAANTALVVNGKAPSIVTVKSDTGILDLSSTTDSVTVGPDAVIGTGVGNAAGVTLTAATVVNLEVPILANGAIAITSPDGFTVKHPLTSNLDGITISAASGPITSVLHPLTAGKAITLTAGGNITLDNAITSTNAGISINAPDYIVTMQEGCVFVAPNLTTGTLSIDAGTFVMGNNITVGSDITVQTVTAFNPTKNFTSTNGNISIAVAGGALGLAGSFLTAPAGSVTLSASGGIEYNGMIVGKAFTVTAGGAVTPQGPLLIPGDITISTGKAYIPPPGPPAANHTSLTGNITITATEAVNVTNIFLKAPLGSISLTSKTQDVTVGAAPNLLTVEQKNTGVITLAAPMGVVTVGQELTAGKDISISSLGLYTSNFELTATTGNVSIATTGVVGGVQINENVIAGYDIVVTTAGALSPIEVNAELTAGHDVVLGTLGTNSPVRINDLVTAGHDIKVTTAGAGSRIEVNANLTAGNDILLSTVLADSPVDLYAAAIAINNISMTTAGNFSSVDVSHLGAFIAPVSANITLTSALDDVILSELFPLVSAIAGNVTVISWLPLNVVTPITAVGGNVTLQSTAFDVYVKANLFASPLIGTLTINAPVGEINNGTVNGPVAATSVTAAKFVATEGPRPPNFPMFQFTNKANTVSELDLTNVAGIGVDFYSAVGFTVSGFTNFKGNVTLESGGGLTVLPTAAIGGGGAVLSNVTLEAVGNIAVTGNVFAATGWIDITSLGAVAVNGDTGSLASVASYVRVNARAGILITGNIVGGDDDIVNNIASIDLNSGAVIDLGLVGTTINITSFPALTKTGNIRITAQDDITISEANVKALANSIQIKSANGAIDFSGGVLEANPVYTPGLGLLEEGLIKLEGPNGITVAASPVVSAGRLEIEEGGPDLTLVNTANKVSSLRARVGGNFTYFQNTVPLSIDDPNDPGYPNVFNTPQVEVSSTGGFVDITSLAGLRVVDGIEYNTTLSLVGKQPGEGIDDAGVEFVPTSGGDNPTTPGFAGTLRDMLDYVNDNIATGPDGIGNTPMRVVFNDPRSPAVVTLADTLPAIVKTITFDGVRVDGSLVEINGAGVKAPFANGLALGSGSAGSVIENAYLYGFNNAAVSATSGQNVFRGLTLGDDAAGNAPGNGIGILLTGPLAVQNIVGIRDVGDLGNTFVANGTGLQIFDRANYTTVQGNGIYGSAEDGIAVVGSLGTLIGSDADGVYANVISRNVRHGIYLENIQGSSIAYGATIQGNTIDANGASGIQITGGGRNLVGGTNIAAGNTITGNGDGVRIESSLLPTPSNNNHIYGNAISGNDAAGVHIEAGFANVVSGNEITENDVVGVRIVSAAAMKGRLTNFVVSNKIDTNGSTENDGGIVIENSKGQAIGFNSKGQVLGNTLTGNTGSGIVIRGNSTHTLNSIVGNTVTGSTFDGIRVSGAVGTTVRGNTASGNRAGIAVADALATTKTGNLVQRNTASGNQVGIQVAGSRFTQVGGVLVADANFVHSNTSDGIRVEATVSAGASQDTVIRNNVVGVAPGSAPAGNTGYGINVSEATRTVVDYANLVRNNTAGGILVEGGNATMIGSAVKGRANTIAANGQTVGVFSSGNGITIQQSTKFPSQKQVNVTVAGNLIESNKGDGISVVGARASAVTIGQAPSITVPNGTGNTIRDNTGVGIRVDAARNVTMIGNSIYDNDAPGGPIVLQNGGNGSLAAPTQLRAKLMPGNVKNPQWEVTGRVGGTTADRFYVDVYMDALSGGQVFMGRVLVQGGKAFRVVLRGPANGVGKAGIRATSTAAIGGLAGSTSAFSAYAV